MATYGMLANIREHSIVVARIAEYLCGALIDAGVALNADLAVRGALLHDIAKTISIESGGDHAREGAAICRRHGLTELAPLVAEHVILRDSFPESPLSEKEIVYYADKRVNHDQIVSLGVRLKYIIGRYGLGDARRCRAIEKNFQRCQVIEAGIFDYLPLEPGDLASEVNGAQGEVRRFFAAPEAPAEEYL